MQSKIEDILRVTLGLSDRKSAFGRDTPLFGALPELDSMAVASVVLAIEEEFDIEIDGEDIDAEAFATLGSLTDLVAAKVDLPAQ